MEIKIVLSKCVLWYTAMNGKPLIWIGLFLGSTIGGFVPALWHAGLFSFSGLLFSTIGGIIGVYIGWKISGDYF